VLGLNQVLPSMKVTTFVSLVTPSLCAILAMAVAWYIPQIKPLAKAALAGLKGKD
jgi:ABC-type sulfate transport system permease component